ncbi:MAG: ATP-binding protein [Burkholderiaceae bacterium]|nr:ATP-binding protein [Burkholderiaceae bacterium]
MASFPAVLLTGPRQSGKTTLLRHEAGADAAYVTFDDPLERDFATTDPEGFLNRFAGMPVILDEIQYVAGLLSYIKMRIDHDPTHCGQWLLTGSQQFGLMRDVSESLAGRVAILQLPPFSQTECARDNLAQVLWNGSYPIPALFPDRRDLWMSSYIATYLERDVRQIRNIPDLGAFNQFLSIMAARHSQVFNQAEISRDLGITLPTVKSWVSVLEASYIAYLLQPWFRNYGKRITKTPKCYFLDTGLANILTRQPDAQSAIAGPLGGPLLEGWVISEAAKVFMSLGRKPDIYYWRSHEGLEVDLLIVIKGKLHPVEIKLSATPTVGHTAPLARFIELAGVEASGNGTLVCQTNSPRTLPGGHMALPWREFTAWLTEQLR